MYLFLERVKNNEFLKNCPDFCGTQLNFVNSFTIFFAFLHCHDHLNTLLNVLMSSVYKHIGMNLLILIQPFCDLPAGFSPFKSDACFE